MKKKIKFKFLSLFQQGKDLKSEKKAGGTYPGYSIVSIPFSAGQRLKEDKNVVQS